MKIEEIIKEDATIVSSSVATVSFPLFGEPGAIRRAVDPHGYIKKLKKKNKPYHKKVKDIYDNK